MMQKKPSGDGVGETNTIGSIGEIFYQDVYKRQLLGDVRKGDVLHPAGFDELPEVELGGLRLAVGGSGVDLLGACLLYTSRCV